MNFIHPTQDFHTLQFRSKHNENILSTEQLNCSLYIQSCCGFLWPEGIPSTLKKPMGPNATISQLQFLQCAKSLVHQQGTVNTQSRKLDPSSLQPSIYKTISNWQKYDNLLSLSTDETLIGSNMVCVSLSSPLFILT